MGWVQKREWTLRQVGQENRKSGAGGADMKRKRGVRAEGEGCIGVDAKSLWE